MAPVFLDLSCKLWKLTPMTTDVINRHIRSMSPWIDAVTTVLVKVKVKVKVTFKVISVTW